MVQMDLFNGVGDIDGITTDSVKNFLNANKKEDIQFNIATMGGDLAEAITTHNLIKTHPGKTIANIVGLTASAGTIIAIACDSVKMSDNTLFLIHNGWTQVTGNIYDLEKEQTTLAKNDAIMVKMYREKTGMPDNQIKILMKASDWLSSNEALNYGLIDSVYSTGQKVAAKIIDQKKSLDNQILIKLNAKMSLFNKNKTDNKSVYSLLELKDGKQLVIKAEAAEVDAEVAAIGAETLENGSFELADGRIITVTDGVITEVDDVVAPDAADTEAIVAAVGEIIAAEIATVKAEMQAEMQTQLASISSKHVPPKGTGTQKQDPIIPNVHGKVNAVVKGINDKLKAERKA